MFFPLACKVGMFPCQGAASPVGLGAGRSPPVLGEAASRWGFAVPSAVPPAPHSVCATLLSPQKHPDFPKKPLTPYFRFFMEKRAKYAKLHPEMSNLDLTKILSKKYKELPEKKKVQGESASPFLCVPLCAGLCLPSPPAKTSRAQPPPGEGLMQLSGFREKPRCLFGPVRPVRLPFFFLSWFPGSVGWRLAGSVRWSVSSRQTWMVT